MNDQNVFKLLKASLFKEDMDVPEDWNDVFEEMKSQTVAGLPSVWLKKHSEADMHEWVTYCAMLQAQWVRVMHGQQMLFQLLEENGIPCIILKGAAAAMYYPYPSLRTMGDVDILVKRADFYKAVELIENNGYKLAHEKQPDAYHYNYEKQKISFELHRRLPILQESDEDLISLFEDGIDHRELKETAGYTFPVLPVHLNGLVLLFHINQHLREGLGLRQIIDWMMYMDKLPEDIWVSEVLPVLRKTGMEKLAYTVTAMCQKYLGLREIVKEDEAYPVDELMAYIMRNGNFGTKDTVRNRISSYSMSVRNVKEVFKRLQSGGLYHWKAAKKHKILQPFAWLYQVFRIIGILLKSKIQPKEILAKRRQGVDQRHLFEMLGLKIDAFVNDQDE